MIQLLINIGPDKAEIFRCDGLIDSVNIPVDVSKGDAKMGLICSTTSLLSIVKEVTVACEEATERAEMLRRMVRLETKMDAFMKRDPK